MNAQNTRQGEDNPFGYFEYYNDNFDNSCIGEHEKYGPDPKPCGFYWLTHRKLTIDEVRHSISFPFIDHRRQQMDNILFLVLNNVRRVVTASSELVGEYDENNTTIERYGIEISPQEPNKEYTSSYKQKLLDIESNLRPIGLFLSKKSKNLYVFFHLGKAIKYCIVDDVSQTEYSGNLVKLFDILVLEEKLQSVV